MLVLTRKPGEEIVIPSLNVTIRLIEIRGDKVRVVPTPTLNLPVDSFLRLRGSRP